MAAFDALPTSVRERVAFHGFPLRATDIRDGLRAAPVPTMLRLIRLAADVFVHQHSARWEKRYGVPSPHAAAGATVQTTEPLHGPAPRWRIRRVPYGN